MSLATRRALYNKMATADAGTLQPAGLGTAAPGYAHAIYYQSAPDAAAFPLIIFNKQAGNPTEAFHDPTALDTEIWLIKAIDHNSTADKAEAIAEALRGLLNDADLTASLSSGTHLYLRRQSDIDYEELAAGETYKHCGSLYRLVLDP